MEIFGLLAYLSAVLALVVAVFALSRANERCKAIEAELKEIETKYHKVLDEKIGLKGQLGGALRIYLHRSISPAITDLLSAINRKSGTPIDQANILLNSLVPLTVSRDMMERVERTLKDSGLILTWNVSIGSIGLSITWPGLATPISIHNNLF